MKCSKGDKKMDKAIEKEYMKKGKSKKEAKDIAMATINKKHQKDKKKK